MIFSELYSAYYNAVAGILREACSHPLSKAELRKIVMREAFGESLLNIEPAILDERWQLLKADGTTPLRHPPTMPLTALKTTSSGNILRQRGHSILFSSGYPVCFWVDRQVVVRSPRVILIMPPSSGTRSKI